MAWRSGGGGPSLKMNAHPGRLASATAAAVSITVAFRARLRLNRRPWRCHRGGGNSSARVTAKDNVQTLGRRGLAVAALLVGLAAGATPRSRVHDDPWLRPALLARAASANPGRARRRQRSSSPSSHTLRAENLLVVMLQRDYDPGVRAAAARALGTTHNPEHIHALRWAADSDHGPGCARGGDAAPPMR